MADGMLQILDEEGRVRDGAEPKLSEADLQSLYRGMLLTRVLDERCMTLQRQGRVAFYGAATGEEASVIGSAFAFEPSDWLFPALRQGGALLMRGFPLERYFHHLMGTGEAVERGRSMPCHYSDREFNFVSWSSNMATQLPHAVGAAYAAKYRGDPTVMAAYLGDGAASEGDFHVAMNFAGVWSAPVVFVLQNNQWAISVPVEKQTASENFAVKGEAYGIPGVLVDGNDVLAVYEATRQAVDRARRGEGPTLIETLTYRMESHSTSDDWTKYRSEEEVAEWAERDPIERFRAYLEAKGVWTQAWEDDLREAFTRDISAAIKKAEGAPAPAHRSLVENVYAEVPPHLEAQYDELMDFVDE